MKKFGRLMLFPREPGPGGGYDIAVGADLARLQPNERDLVVFRSSDFFEPDSRPTSISSNSVFSKIFNFVRRRTVFEVSRQQLLSVLPKDLPPFEDIFSGEIIFYRALRQLYPKAHIWVRLHNFWSLSKYRQEMLKPPINFKLRLNFSLFSRLEQEVFSDPVMK